MGIFIFFFSSGFFLTNLAISLISLSFFNLLSFISILFLLGNGGGGGGFFLITGFSIFFLTFFTVFIPNFNEVFEDIGVSSTISIGCSIISFVLKLGKPKYAAKIKKVCKPIDKKVDLSISSTLF